MYVCMLFCVNRVVAGQNALKNLYVVGTYLVVGHKFSGPQLLYNFSLHIFCPWTCVLIHMRCVYEMLWDLCMLCKFCFGTNHTQIQKFKLKKIYVIILIIARQENNFIAKSSFLPTCSSSWVIIYYNKILPGIRLSFLHNPHLWVRNTIK